MMFSLLSKPLLIMAVLATVFFGYIGLTKHHQAIGYNRAKVEDTAEATRLNNLNRIKEAELQAAVAKAQHDALTRQTELKAAADTSLAAVASLRNQLANTQRRLSAASKPALINYASTSNQLLDECSAAYQSMAAKADGHASDALTLQSAWPR